MAARSRTTSLAHGGSKTKPNRQAGQKAVEIFRGYGGLLRMSDAIKQGIHRATLYEMLDDGLVERLSRGLYRLADAKSLGNPDLVTVAKRVPGGVICLISALAFYDLTDQIPHAVDVAVSRNAEPPRVDYPPIHAFRFSAEAFSEGVSMHTIDGFEVRIYSPEKTLADCFKFRNKIGMDTTLDALQRYKNSRRVQVEPLMHFADICRVARVMRPYLEAML